MKRLNLLKKPRSRNMKIELKIESFRVPGKRKRIEKHQKEKQSQGEG
jgi:hypothetical protein